MNTLGSLGSSLIVGIALLAAGCGGPANRDGDRNVASPEAVTINVAAPVSPLATPVAQPTAQPRTTGQAFEKGFDTGFAKTFAPSCRSSAAPSGLPAAKIAEVCDCALTDLQAKFSAGQLMTLTPEQAGPSLEMCATKVGLTKRGG